MGSVVGKVVMSIYLVSVGQVPTYHDLFSTSPPMIGLGTENNVPEQGVQPCFQYKLWVDCLLFIMQINSGIDLAEVWKKENGDGTNTTCK